MYLESMIWTAAILGALIATLVVYIGQMLVADNFPIPLKLLTVMAPTIAAISLVICLTHMSEDDSACNTLTFEVRGWRH